MTGHAYFQSPETPDKLYEIVTVDKEKHKVTVRDEAAVEYVLDLNLLKLLHWKIVQKEDA